LSNAPFLFYAVVLGLFRLPPGPYPGFKEQIAFLGRVFVFIMFKTNFPEHVPVSGTHKIFVAALSPNAPTCIAATQYFRPVFWIIILLSLVAEKQS